MKTNFTDIKVQTTASVIVHGANQIGFALAKSLLEQGGRVIIIDHFTTESKKYITELKKIGNSDFVDFQGIEELFKTIGRVDYLFYLQYNFLQDKLEFSSKDFLQESNHLNLSLKAAQKYNAKIAVITTIDKNKTLVTKISHADHTRPSPYSAEELQKYCETLTAEYHDKSRVNVRIIRLGNFIGTNYQEDLNPILTGLLDESVTGETINIKGEGLETHYLIHMNDAIYGILKLTFTDQTNGEVVSLANDKEYTTISLAYKLLELNPEAKEIKFIADTEKRPLAQTQYIPAPNAEKYGWSQKMTLDDAMVETLTTFYAKHKKDWKDRPDKEKDIKEVLDRIKSNRLTAQPSVTTVKTPLGEAVDMVSEPASAVAIGFGKTIKSFFAQFNLQNIAIFTVSFVVFGCIFYIFLIPVINITAASLLSYREIKSAEKNLNALDFAAAANNLSNTSEYIDRASGSFERIRWVFTITGQEDMYTNGVQLMYGAKYGADGARDMIEATEPLADYLKNFEPALNFQDGQPTTTREYRDQLNALDSNRGQIEKAGQSLLVASDLIDSVETAAFPKPIQKYIVNIKEENTNLSQSILPMQHLIVYLPEMLGLEERQRYLILLQNPSEIRSTGGWISSYILLGVERGQIREMTVDDVYNAEGQLKLAGKEYSAPASMQQALDVKTWNLSTSNWDPNFPDSAQDAEYFIKELGKINGVDAVITIDVPFIQKLLDIWGGIEVPGEDKKITSKNLNEKIFEIHNNFVPGETAKSTFLANLANETIKRLLSADLSEYKSVSNVLLTSLNEKHILLDIRNDEIREYLSDQSWSGELNDKYTGAPIAVDWNWGGNKSNLYLEKTHNLKMEVVSENEIRYVYSIAVENKSDSEIYPQGNYINYMRIYLPLNAEVLSTAGFDTTGSDNFEEDGFKVIGGWFNVPINSTKTFELNYTVKNSQGESPFVLRTSGNQVAMDLNIFKQPGTLEDTYKLNIVYPSGWIVENTDDLNLSLAKLTGQFKLDTDKTYNIVWQKP